MDHNFSLYYKTFHDYIPYKDECLSLFHALCKYALYTSAPALGYFLSEHSNDAIGVVNVSLDVLLLAYIKWLN